MLMIMLMLIVMIIPLNKGAEQNTGIKEVKCTSSSSSFTFPLEITCSKRH